MEIADDIRKRGFRKWYERQLIESHAYLVTCFLCMILVAALLEEINFRAPGMKSFVMLVVMAGSGLLGWFSWQRYRTIMVAAERFGGHSTCAQCAAYGRLEVLASGGEPAGAGDQPETWLRVRCRKCGHEWTMP